MFRILDIHYSIFIILSLCCLYFKYASQSKEVIRGFNLLIERYSLEYILYVCVNFKGFHFLSINCLMYLKMMRHEHFFEIFTILKGFPFLNDI